MLTARRRINVRCLVCECSRDAGADRSKALDRDPCTRNPLPWQGIGLNRPVPNFAMIGAVRRQGLPELTSTPRMQFRVWKNMNSLPLNPSVCSLAPMTAEPQAQGHPTISDCSVSRAPGSHGHGKRNVAQLRVPARIRLPLPRGPRCKRHVPRCHPHDGPPRPPS